MDLTLGLSACPAVHALRYCMDEQTRGEVPLTVSGKLGLHAMINGKRIAVVMPAYNAEKTLEVTVGEIPDLVDIRILVDDHSKDQTVDVAHRLGLFVFQHDRNYGYGRNQQTCYREALAAGADVVIMLHPDYQYTPLLITAMASMVAYDVYDVVLGSRIIGGRALLGGMPLYKYISNRAAHRVRKSVPGREAFRVSHRISRLQPARS